MRNDPAGDANSSSAPSSSSSRPIRGIGEFAAMNRWLASSVSMPSVISDGNQPGQSALTAHALARPLQRQLAGEVHDGTLARAVVRLLDRCGTDVSEHRRHVDDRTGTGGDHRRRAELGQVPQRGDVHLHRRAESLQRLVLDRDRATDAGVVHEHVDATEPGEHVGDESSAIGLVRHVGDDDVCPGKLGGERLEPLGAPGGQHHLRADAVEYGREVRAES